MQARFPVSAKHTFQAAVIIVFLAWSILPYSRMPILAVISVPLFFILLLVTSHRVYLERRSEGRSQNTFKQYTAAHRVLAQDIALAIILGMASLTIELIRSAFIAVGVLLALSVIDSIWLILTAYFFFKRPGLKKILGRSFPAGKPESARIEELSLRYGKKAPELRIFAPGRRRVPNAFSWSLPGTDGYIFANEELYEVLDKDEVSGIFSHELGHIIKKHSEKSFLLSSLVPLTWLDCLILSFGFVSWPFYILAASGVFAFGVAYILRIRGIVSRMFERSADKFAGKNYDRETYIRALRKLSENTPYKNGNGKRFGSHDSLEKREELIRSL